MTTRSIKGHDIRLLLLALLIGVPLTMVPIADGTGRQASTLTERGDASRAGTHDDQSSRIRSGDAAVAGGARVEPGRGVADFGGPQIVHGVAAPHTSPLARAGASGALSSGPSTEADSPMRDRVRDIAQELSSLFEEVDDLGEPVGEFEIFDQCMYLVGVTEYGTRSSDAGYVYDKGGRSRQPAFAMDVSGFDPPQYQFIAYPGEEPPSIECNEDAEARPDNAQ
jgi:hypothetical protein